MSTSKIADHQSVDKIKVARFFLVQQTKMKNNIPTWPQKTPNSHETYQNGYKVPHDPEMYQILQPKSFHNLPKLAFLV
jgi:hypothetical protein